MSAALLTRPRTRRVAAGAAACRTQAVATEAVATTPTMGPTLDEALSGLWAQLRSADAVACPVCGGAMRPRHTAGAGVVGGRCGGCATTLA
jgi:hypothetical protein